MAEKLTPIVVDALMVLRDKSENIDLDTVEIMEMKHRSDVNARVPKISQALHTVRWRENQRQTRALVEQSPPFLTETTNY